MSSETTIAPQKPSIFLAVLCYGGVVHQEWMQGVIGLLTKTQLIGAVSIVSGDSLVCRARNNLASEFLSHTGCTHLLFVDCDIIFEPWMVQRLMSHQKPLVCGMYPLKQVKPGWVVNNVPGETDDARGLVKVRESGTGFMLIEKSVFAQMAESYPELAYDVDDNEKGRHQRYDFFSVGVYRDPVINKRRYLSEDYYFCQRWREMGGDVYLDTKVRAKHIGRATYPLAEAELRAAVYEIDRSNADNAAKTAQEAKPAA